MKKATKTTTSSRARSSTPAAKKPQRSLLERKVKFARKHWRAPGGDAFEIAEDGWLYREFWLPLHSFRVTPVDKAQLCSDCARGAGQLVERYARPGCVQKASACSGVRCEPIQFIFLDLPRRSGKTTGTSGYVAAALFRGENERIGFVAGSEDQSERLFTEHYEAPILENPKLNACARIVGNVISVWKSARDKRIGTPASGRFEFLPTSVSGTTGGKYTVVIVEEARAVPSNIASTLLPATWDQNGWQCPNGVRGHTKTKGDLDDPNHPTNCATCGGELEPWVGKFLAMSSAGELTGGVRDWFFEACDLAEKDPSPRVHVYRASGVINRKVAESSVAATAGFLGKVESMRDFIEIETSNTARRRGEEFLSQADIAAVIDKRLQNAAAGARPGVAFLDTSDVVELTSLVVLEDDSVVGTEKPWDRVVNTYVRIWDPKKLKIRIEAPMLEQFLAEFVPLFKLLRLRIDDRHATWVRNMVARLKKLPWGRIVIGCTEYTTEDRRFAWRETERRVLGKTIRLQDEPTMRKELRAARKFRDMDNRVDVREVSRKRRHLDVAESLAGCCFDIQDLIAKSRLGLATADPSADKSASAMTLAKLFRGRDPARDVENF